MSRNNMVRGPVNNQALAVVVALLMALLSDCSRAQVCQDGGTNLVPHDFVGDEPGEYDSGDASLRIFTALRVTCNGILTDWRFVSKHQTIWNLHLAIFRKPDEANTDNTFTLVLDTYINNYTVPRSKLGKWLYYPVQSTVSVQRGDYLGIFYDSYALPKDKTTICFKQSDVSADNTPSEIVIPIGKPILNQLQNTVVVEVMPKARRDRLVPGLTAMVRTVKTDGEDHKNELQETALAMATFGAPFATTTTTTTTTTVRMPVRKVTSARLPPTAGAQRIVGRGRSGPVAATTRRTTTTTTTTTFASINTDDDQIPTISGDLDLPPEIEISETSAPTTTTSATTRVTRARRTRVMTTTMMPTPSISQGQLPIVTFETNGGQEEIIVPTSSSSRPTRRRRPATTTTTTQFPATILLGNQYRGPSIQSGGYFQVIQQQQQQTLRPRPLLTPRVVRVGNPPPETDKPFAKNSVCFNKPLDQMKCSDVSQRAFFDSNLNTCKLFWGCGPPSSVNNPNNFATISQCVDACYTTDTLDPVCSRAPTTAVACQNESLRYYFESILNKCVAFRGCALDFQIANNFASMEECSKRCNGSMHPRITAIGIQPKDARRT